MYVSTNKQERRSKICFHSQCWGKATAMILAWVQGMETSGEITLAYVCEDDVAQMLAYYRQIYAENNVPIRGVYVRRMTQEQEPRYTGNL